jgi:hypothetical protein
MPTTPETAARLDLEEIEFLWCLCFGVAKGEIAAHPEYIRIAKQLEPRLYAAVKELVPGWESPLKQRLN